MSPTRRDILKLSLVGLATAAVPAVAMSHASAEPWGAREYGDYFQRCMAISFPHYRDLSVEMKSERMVLIDGKRTHIGLTTAEGGETVLFAMSSQPLDECGLKIALNGLAMAFAAE